MIKELLGLIHPPFKHHIIRRLIKVCFLILGVQILIMEYIIPATMYEYTLTIKVLNNREKKDSLYLGYSNSTAVNDTLTLQASKIEGDYAFFSGRIKYDTFVHISTSRTHTYMTGHDKTMFLYLTPGYDAKAVMDLDCPTYDSGRSNGVSGSPSNSAHLQFGHLQKPVYDRMAPEFAKERKAIDDGDTIALKIIRAKLDTLRQELNSKTLDAIWEYGNKWRSTFFTQYVGMLHSHYYYPLTDEQIALIEDRFMLMPEKKRRSIRGQIIPWQILYIKANRHYGNLEHFIATDRDGCKFDSDSLIREMRKNLRGDVLLYLWSSETIGWKKDFERLENFYKQYPDTTFRLVTMHIGKDTTIVPEVSELFYHPKWIYLQSPNSSRFDPFYNLMLGNLYLPRMMLIGKYEQVWHEWSADNDHNYEELKRYLLHSTYTNFRLYTK